MQEKKSTFFSGSQGDAQSVQEIQLAYEHLRIAYEELLVRNRDLEISFDYNRSILDAIDRPLIVLDDSLRICTANRSFFDQFRLSSEREEDRFLPKIGNGLFDLPALKTALQRVFSGDLSKTNIEATVQPPETAQRILSFDMAQLDSDHGCFLILSIDDVTERKILEQKKDEFISIASHELKTPATSIQAYTQILYYEFLGANDYKSAGMVSKLNGQVSRLARLTKDLLDVTKITEGQLRLKEEYFDLNVLIDEVVEQMQLTTYQRIIVKQKHKQETSNVWGDRERLEQVLVNLIANAIKYSPESEPVIVTSDIEQGELQLSVQDFGIGIPADKRAKVFDRFFRSDDPLALKHPGLGLGLYISYEIVRKHGGKINIESGKNKGTVFSVILPNRAG